MIRGIQKSSIYVYFIITLFFPLASSRIVDHSIPHLIYNIDQSLTKLSFNRTSFKDSNMTLTLRMNLNINKTYLLRLDYLPFMAVDSNNDNLVAYTGQYHQSVIRIRLKSLPVNKSQNFQYVFLAEVRQAYQFDLPYFNKSITVYTYLIRQYLVILLVLFGLSFKLQKWLFQQQPQQEQKNQ